MSRSKDDGGPKDPFDPSDPEAFRRWLVALRVAFDDGDSIVEDMLAPVRERHFGHLKHLELWGEARAVILEMLDRALGRRREDDGEGGEPTH